MSLTATEVVRYTPEQYLTRERKAEVRSEYVDGGIYPMAGASRLHNHIAGNLYAEIRACLRNRTGEVFVSEMRVHVGPAGLYTYPDVVAVMGEPVLEDEEMDTLLNPTLIVEVLSESTEAYDRGDKFARYRRLESLREYVLVAQDRVRVESFLKRGGEWVLMEWSGIDEVVRLESIGCEVAMREVYAKTKWGGEGKAD